MDASNDLTSPTKHKYKHVTNHQSRKNNSRIPIDYVNGLSINDYQLEELLADEIEDLDDKEDYLKLYM